MAEQRSKLYSTVNEEEFGKLFVEQFQEKRFLMNATWETVPQPFRMSAEKSIAGLSHGLKRHTLIRIRDHPIAKKLRITKRKIQLAMIDWEFENVAFDSQGRLQSYCLKPQRFNSLKSGVSVIHRRYEEVLPKVKCWYNSMFDIVEKTRVQVGFHNEWINAIQQCIQKACTAERAFHKRVEFTKRLTKQIVKRSSKYRYTSFRADCESRKAIEEMLQEEYIPVSLPNVQQSIRICGYSPTPKITHSVLGDSSITIKRQVFFGEDFEEEVSSDDNSQWYTDTEYEEDDAVTENYFEINSRYFRPLNTDDGFP